MKINTEKYIIEIWETEEYRDMGEGYVYNKEFDNFKDALKEVRKLFDDNHFASIEILDEDNKAYCCIDDDSEEFYIHDYKFSKLPNEIVDEYIDNWMDKKELPTKENRFYCEMVAGGYLGVDNSSGECYVEEFDTEEQVHKWLSGVEKEDILKENDGVEI